MQKEKRDTGCVYYGMADWKDTVGRSIRTEGCIMSFCEEGTAVVSVEFRQRTVSRGDVVMIFPDTMFVVNEVSGRFAVRQIELQMELFDEVTFTLSSHLFDWLYDNPVFHVDTEHWELINVWLRQLQWIMQGRVQKTVYVMMRNHVQNFFIGLESVVVTNNTVSQVQPASSARTLFNRFCRLLVEHCHAHHDVSFYADALCITPYYLSKITGRTIKVSPKELIDRQIILEMKRLLTTTDIPVKELAVRFHFDTVSYMARFFRRHTGVTPSEFRKM